MSPTSARWFEYSAAQQRADWMTGKPRWSLSLMNAADICRHAGTCFI